MVEVVLLLPVTGAVIESELGLVESEKSGPDTFTMTLVKSKVEVLLAAISMK